MSSEEKRIAEVLAGHSAHVKSLVEDLRWLVRAEAPELREEAKTGWGNIAYKKNRMVCAISPHTEHVNLNFYQGTRLTDPEGLLEGTGNKLRHVNIRTREDVGEEALTEMIREAMTLDAGDS